MTAEEPARGCAWTVEAIEVSRHFGDAPALRAVTVRLSPGERLAIFGPNGAGKTTLLRLLATLIAPTGGTLRLFGLDPRRDANPVRRRIGVVGHRTYLDDNLTGAENLAFYARLYDVPEASARIDDVLERVGLADRRGLRSGVLSRGQQQRLALARALIHDPDLLLLDEPDTGLDAAGLEMLAAAIERPAERPARSVVLTSHHPERAARIAPRSVLLTGGRIVAEGPTATLALAGEWGPGARGQELEAGAPTPDSRPLPAGLRAVEARA